MNRKAWLMGAGALALAAAGFFGYRALGDWLTAQMTGKIKAPEATGPALAPSQPAQAPQSPAAAISSLDLIVKTAAAAPASGKAMSAEQLAAVRQAGVGLVDSLKPLLNDPALTSRLTPDQANQYRQLMAILGRAESTVKTSGPLDLREMAADVQKAQQISLSLMSQLPAAQPPKENAPK